MTCLSRTAVGLVALSLATACGSPAVSPASGVDAGPPDAALPDARGEHARTDAGGAWSPPIDPSAFGSADVSRAFTVAAFSQSNLPDSDPQVLELGPRPRSSSLGAVGHLRVAGDRLSAQLPDRL